MNPVDYFHSLTAMHVFALLHLPPGECNKLTGIKQIHFVNKALTRAWVEELKERIRTEAPEAVRQEALKAADEAYHRITGERL